MLPNQKDATVRSISAARIRVFTARGVGQTKCLGSVFAAGCKKCLSPSPPSLPPSLPLIPPNTSRQHSRAIPEIDPSVVPPPPPPRRRNPILRRSATVAQVGGTHDCRRDRSGAISQFVVVAGHGPNMDDVSPPLEWD